MALAGGAWAAGNYALAEAVPVIFLTRQAGLHRRHADGRIEWYPAGGFLVWLSLYAAAAFSAFMLYYDSAEGGLEGELQRSMAALFQDLDVSLAPAARELIDAFVGILPGLGGATWLLITAGNAALAQALLQRFGHNLRPGPALATLTLPSWLTLAVAATAALGLLGAGRIGFAGRNLCFVLVVFFRRAGVPACAGAALELRLPPDRAVLCSTGECHRRLVVARDHGDRRAWAH